MNGAPRRWSRLLLAATLVVAAGCQLSDTADSHAEAAPGAATAAVDPVLGNPDDDWPETLQELREIARPEALSWQDEPVLADVTVWLEPTGAWERVRLTYVAGDAERMLTYRAQPDELRLERPRLAGLQLRELPQKAVLAIEAFPEEALEPVALAEAAAPALAQCDAAGQPVRAVLYATGAPAAWDGTRWTRTPTWRATVVTPAGGVVVDPVTGQAFAPLTCVDPLLLSAE